MAKFDRDLDDFQVTLPSGEWTVVQQNNRGLCVRGLQVIVVNPCHRGKDLLDTFVHEACHSLFQNLSEEAVTEAAKAITTILWKAGYRRRSERPLRKHQRSIKSEAT